MPESATLILVIIITLITNPINPILLICPFAFSVLYETILKKYNTSDTVIATLAIFLLFSGIIFFLLGVGLTSPLFTTNVTTSNSINTKIFFNEQNLSNPNTSGNIQIFNGINNSNVSILNISTTLEPPTVVLDFGMLGLVIGIVSLGFSIVISAVSIILTIQKSYEESSLNKEEYRKISIIWIIFGIIIVIYGYVFSDQSSILMKLFGMLYLDFGLLLFICSSLTIQFERNFNQKIQSVITQINAANRNEQNSQFSFSKIREQFNKFSIDKKSMEPLQRAWVMLALSGVFTVYGLWAVFHLDTFINYLPVVLIIDVGLGALTWAVVALYKYYFMRTPQVVTPQVVTIEPQDTAELREE